MRRRFVLLAILAATLWMRPAMGHGGGTPQLTDAEAGPYRLFAWTEPEPWRVGEVHLSVAVTLPSPDGERSDRLEQAVTDAEILVNFQPRADLTQSFSERAQNQSGLNSVYYETDTALRWPVSGVSRSRSAGKRAAAARF